MVLDVGLRPTPTGVIGELYLTGDRVLSYLNRMQLTAEMIRGRSVRVGHADVPDRRPVRRLADGRPFTTAAATSR